MDGVLARSEDGALEEREEVGHIGFIERQRVLGQHEIAIDRVGAGGHAGAGAEQVLFFSLVLLSGRS